MTSQFHSADAEATPIPRRLWIVIPLVLTGGPFAFVYRGQLGRAIRWQLAMWCLSFHCAAIVLYTPASELALWGFAGGLLVLLFAIIRLASRPQLMPWRSYQRWWSYLAIFVVFVVSQMSVAHAIRTYWCEAFFVPTKGMANTILAGDRFLLEKLVFSNKDLKRGSVLAFRSPPYRNVSDIILVKRVIALEGDKVRLEKDQVYVNDLALDEPYTQFESDKPPQSYAVLRDLPQQEVPKGHVFVVGDNRWQSLDSRSFGLVPMANLIGEAKIVFWSQEYELVPPSRENPQGGEQWGAIRWDRIGQAIPH